MFQNIYPPPQKQKQKKNCVQTKCNNKLPWQPMAQQTFGFMFFFLKPLLEAFKFINIFKIIYLMKVLIRI